MKIMQDKAKKCVIYCRVSSREQEETGYSLASQEKFLKEYASSKNLSIKKIFSVSESASGRKQREMFDKMLAMLKKEKINTIICEKVDRLTRNMKDAVSLQDWFLEDEEREVHCVKESFILGKNTKAHENFVWDMKVAVARLYSNNLSEEVRKGQKEKIAQGWLPSRSPIGYISEGEDGHRIHILDPKKAPLIRQMFELYASGDYSLQRLTNKMAELGLRNRTGRKVVKSGIVKLLNSHFYYGKIKWKGKLYDGKQKPIISRSLFETVQQVMLRKDAPKYSKHFYLFKRLIKCSLCGGAITWQLHKGWVYGYCNGYKGCPKKSAVREDIIEQDIIELLEDMKIQDSRIIPWAKKAITYSQKTNQKASEASREGLEKQIAIIKNRLENLYDDKIDGKISEEFYTKKANQYTEEYDRLIQALEKLGITSSEPLQHLSLFELSQRAKEIYEESKDDIPRKRLLLQFLYESMKLNQDREVEYDHTKAFGLLTGIIEKTNGSNNEISAYFDSGKFEPPIFPLSKTKTAPESADFALMLGC